MRREQVLKICLNHALTPELIFRPKDEKSWLWGAQDFTEGEGKMETFVLRFRDAEISKAFMDAVNKVIELNFMSISSKLNFAVLFLGFSFSSICCSRRYVEIIFCHLKEFLNLFALY
jgi:hypothetical protein